jgi:apolipoprotein N-acyltransferase
MTGEPTSSGRSEAWLTWAGTSLTALLLFFSFGPVGHPFWAFVALVPATLAASLRPDGRTWRRAAFVTSWVLWIALLVWLRHVYPPLGWLGLVLLTAYCALYPFVWLLLVRWIFPACAGASLPARLLAIGGLAGAWGLLEWTRGTILSGFGWLPLAASQTGNPVMLSLCAWAGPTGLSIALVLFNLGLARWIVRLVEFYREDAHLAPTGPAGWLRRITPELYLGLAPIALGFFALLAANGAKLTTDKVSFTPAVVQTDFDPNAKWDANRLQEHLVLTEQLTANVAANQAADFVLWPEAALPLSLESDAYVSRLTGLAKAVETPLVIGAIDRRGAGYGNAVAVLTADGVQKPVYAKRHLVPFGEYVPFADFLPLRKVVPIPSDCVAGTGPSLLPLTTRRGHTFMAGALVCYEDVFPELAREHARAGADILLVVTNDAWYGREAGAYQHAAHSVLLAAATGLPVVRCGNAGWSGTIDSLGRAFPVTEQGSVYFRGARVTAPVSLPRVRQPDTFWVRQGDWAVGLGGVLFALAYVWRRRRG